METSPEPSTPRSTDASLTTRDRLVAALLAGQGDQGGRFALVEYSEASARLVHRGEPLRIVLLRVGAGAAPETLRAWFTGEVKKSDIGGTELHIVAVGGGAAATDALKQSIPRSHSTPLGFHHLDDAGRLARVGTHMGARKLPELAEAAAREDVAPLSPEQLAAALAEGQALPPVRVPAVNRLSGSYRVTAVITAACVVFMGLELLWKSVPEISVYAAMGANRGLAVQQGELWRLLASAFLHADVVHLLVNMLALWSFGAVLETLLGPRRYLILYGASALGGSLASAFLGPDRWSVGASGAIWGLMAAGIAIAYWPRDLLPREAVEPLRKRAWVPLLINVGYSLQPGIDLLAHIGGGVVGFALMASLLTRGLRPVAERVEPSDAERGPSRAVGLGAAAVGLAMALSVAVAFAEGRPWALNAALVYQRTPIGDTGFTVELPDVLARHASVEQKAGLRIFTFAKLPEVPVAFEFIVGEGPSALSPEEAEAMLESERATIDQVDLPGFTRVEPARLVTIAGRRAVQSEHRRADLALRSYFLLLGRHMAMVRRSALGETPPAWSGVEEAVIATLTPP